MATAGTNLAVTKDGETYNKLSRPAEYLACIATPSLRTASTKNPLYHVTKRKRERDASLDGKRLKVELSSESSNSGDCIRESGMRVLLPGLDGDEDQLSDSSTSEALAYLRSVRSEASTMPQLLLALTHCQDDVTDDERIPDSGDADDAKGLIYEDGVWMAVDKPHDADQNDHGHANLDIQDGYYNMLLQRFQSLRQKLTEAKTKNTSQTKGKCSERARLPRTKTAWSQAIETECPTPSQLAQINQQTLFSGIRQCALSLSQSSVISHTKCCWIWALLAAVGDQGTLDHELIGRLRELGIHAGQMCNRSRNVKSCHSILSSVHEDGDSKSNGQLDIEIDVSDGEAENLENTMLGHDVGNDEGRYSGTSLTQPHNERPDHLDGGKSKHDQDISTSADEQSQSLDENGKEALEQARARLLAQLGDRLVQTALPLSRVEAEQQHRQRQECQKRDTNDRVTATDEHSRSADEHVISEPEWNTRTAVDMILTVLAECYGQKDLLKFRRRW